TPSPRIWSSPGSPGKPLSISKAAATLAQLIGSSPAVSPGLSWWSGKAELIYHGGYPCPLLVSEALNRQRQTRVRSKAEVLGDGRGHAQTAAVLLEQRPERTESLRFRDRTLSMSCLGGTGNGESWFGEGAADDGVPGIAAGVQPCRGERVAGDPDRDVLRDHCPNPRNMRTRLFRIDGYAGDLDRRDPRELGNAGVQLCGEGEVRGAGVVVDDHRQLRVLGDGAVELEHVIRGERLICHRRQQHPGRARRFRTVDVGEDVGGAQAPDSDEHGCGAGLLDCELCDACTLVRGEVSVGASRAERSNRIHLGRRQLFDEPGERCLVDGVVVEWGEWETAQAGEHAGHGCSISDRCSRP